MTSTQVGTARRLTMTHGDILRGSEFRWTRDGAGVAVADGRAIGRQAETWVPLLKIVFECL